MTFSELATARYEPRPADAPAELFQSRLENCQKCPLRRAHTCTAARPPQLCSIIARPAGGYCPTGLWGTPPRERPVLARAPRQPTAADRIGPVQAAEPLPDCWQPLEAAAIVRNLICHVYPLRAGQKWRRAIDELAARRGLFNGRRLISIATDHECDPPEAVRDALAAKGFDAEFFEYPNDPTLGEVRTFRPALEQLARPDPNHLTFYCHTKGATWPDDDSPAHEWGAVMWRACLDFPAIVTDLVSRAPICGAFRHFEKLGADGTKSCRWHFSGTFFWFRHDVVFSPMRRVPWRAVDQAWTGVETWPGLQFRRAESACLFFDDVGAKGRTLYDPDYWEDIIRPAWRRWQLRAGRAGRQTSDPQP